MYECDAVVLTDNNGCYELRYRAEHTGQAAQGTIVPQTTEERDLLDKALTAIASGTMKTVRIRVDRGRIALAHD